MTKPSFFSPGQTIVLREIWQGKVWSARPEIVVRDTSELLALYVVPGIIWKQPVAPDGQRINAQSYGKPEWKLKDAVWEKYCRLRMTIPGADYSVLIFRDKSDMNHRSWYINLEDPLRRTPQGFDYMDEILDILVKPDFSEWRWKDEGELEEAIAAGGISGERAAAMRVEGEKVVRWLQSGKSPFNAWVNWRPDPAWEIPVLPAGWDKI